MLQLRSVNLAARTAVRCTPPRCAAQPARLVTDGGDGDAAVLEAAAQSGVGSEPDDPSAGHGDAAQAPARRRRSKSSDTRWLIAAAHLGKPKSAEWRAKIGETQRQRQALKREAAAAAAPPPGKVYKLHPPVRLREKRLLDKAAASAAEWEERRKKLPLLAPAPPAQLSKEQLDEYQKDLRLYRTLRKELQTWSDAFAEEHGRRPDKKDVADTRIPWLIETFQEYTQLKRKLLSRTPALRGSLATAVRAELPRPLAPGETPL